MDQGDQLKAESGKVDRNRNPTKMKTCFSCGQEGHLSQGKRCLMQGQACRKCGAIGHFKVKWPQLYQQSGAQERGVAEVDTVELAEVQVDLVKVDIDVKDWNERQTLWLEDLALEKKTKEICYTRSSAKTLLCLFS